MTDDDSMEVEENEDPPKPTVIMGDKAAVGKISVGAGSTVLDAATGTIRVKNSDGTETVLAAGGLASGGILSGITTTSTFPSVTTTRGGITMPTPTPAKAKTPKVVEGPTKMPRKLLVAFLDDEDNVEWCAKVRPRDCSVDFSLSEAAPIMSIEFMLIEADPE